MLRLSCVLLLFLAVANSGAFPTFPTSCDEVKSELQLDTNGSYLLFADKADFNSIFLGYCIFDSEGGWLSLMRRSDGLLTFIPNWENYKNGFGGDMGSNFWLGNELIHKLTTKYKATLKISLAVDVPFLDKKPEKKVVKYTRFRVGNESSKYRLDVGGFSGDGQDGMSALNGNPFSVVQRGSGQWFLGKYSSMGAWWYGDRKNMSAYLTGVYTTPPGQDVVHNVQWNVHVAGHGVYHLDHADMMIKY